MDGRYFSEITFCLPHMFQKSFARLFVLLRLRTSTLTALYTMK